MCELLHTSAWCATSRDRWSQGKKWITLPLLLPGCGTATEVLRCRKLTRCADFVAKAGDFSCKWGGLICWNGPHHAPFEGVGITDWC
jgi:hypothetical protein